MNKRLIGDAYDDIDSEEERDECEESAERPGRIRDLRRSPGWEPKRSGDKTPRITVRRMSVSKSKPRAGICEGSARQRVSVP